jgi:hypothetical protein
MGELCASKAAPSFRSFFITAWIDYSPFVYRLFGLCTVK